MECTLKGVIRYDGTGFAGWQNQPGRRTVQGELEAALSRIADRPVQVQGAGRTDAGVHALGQVFSCVWPGPLPPRLCYALCSMLRPEISIISLEEAPPGFNARFSARAKRYAYTIELARHADPFSARYAWHVPYELDLDLMRSLLSKLEGRRDFAAFQSTGNQMPSTVRTLFSVRLVQGGVFGSCDARNLWQLEFHGDGFLYHMVRNITGTLVEIARGRFPTDFLETCLAAGGPFRGHCAPAHGLALVSVAYDAAP